MILPLTEIFSKKIILITIFLLVIQNILAQNNNRFELVDIRFYGNKSFSSSQLEAQLESKRTPWWFWKFLKSFTPLGSEKKYFDSLNIAIDKRAINDFYLTNGFFLAIVNASYQIDTLNKQAILNFFIEEGIRASFGKLNLFGIESLQEIERTNILKRFASISEGQPFRQNEIQKNINDVLRYLTNNGYLFAQYDSAVVIKDTVSFIADVSIYFNIGNKHFVNGINILKSGPGASDISDQLINDIVDLKSGENYDQSRLERSELRLLRTGLFNSISVNPVIKDTQNNFVPIEILAQVSTLNEISPELKIDNDFNAFNTGLGINLARKNFFGNARKLSVSTSFRIIDILAFDFSNLFKSSSRQDSTYQGVTDLELGLEQPYLFGRPILTATKAYYRSSTFKQSTEKLIGASQSFDFEMPEYTFITLLKPQFSLELTEFDVNYSTIDISLDAKSLTPAIGAELGSYKTNDLFFPLAGFNLYLYPEFFQARTDLKLTSSDSSAEISQTGWFWKIQTSFAQFFSVSRDNNGALGWKFKIGYIQSIYGNYDLIPPNKTFFSGGSNSVRGWRSRELLPDDEVEYFGITNRGDKTPRGGTFLIEGSLEFRRKFMEDFGFAVFLDYGNVWNGYKKISFNQLAAATGLGLRYYSPIAPFRIDFGIKLFNPDDKSFIFNKKFLSNIEFHFGIGEAF